MDEMKDIPLIHYMFSIICQTFIYIFYLKDTVLSTEWMQRWIGYRFLP